MKTYTRIETVKAFIITAIRTEGRSCPDWKLYATTEVRGDGGESVIVKANWMMRYDPKCLGYCVIHGNGSPSYCSAEEFEKDYTPE